jgi:uncharacterized protein with NAD-binding domain and iron-sulfur cluster
VAAAFELSRPEHQGRFELTIYQLGWRMGGKGASGRGPAGRIEEHGLHVWLGFYENAFRLMRECYAELGRHKAECPIADWQDAFFPAPKVGITQPDGQGGWQRWSAAFPPAPGLPGDPMAQHNPFTLQAYLGHLARLVKALLVDLQSPSIAAAPTAALPADAGAVERLLALARTWARLPALAAGTALIEAAALVELALAAVPRLAETTALKLLAQLTRQVRRQMEAAVSADPTRRCQWEILDLVLAIFVGCVRERLLLAPQGLEAIDHIECRDWLRLHGASEQSINGAFVRGLYDLALAYEDGDPSRPGLAAGQALRGSLRMFFTYRGALFWKMRAGMGDVVFAPFYEVLKKRGVTFRFFHRLENVGISEPDAADGLAARPFVSSLRFDVQAQVLGGQEYQPLLPVQGLPCWPAEPDWAQLEDGEALRAAGVRFEDHWDTRRAQELTLHVGRDFDFVVLGVSVGSIEHTCGEILARDARWRAMVKNVKTVATQALQVWLAQDMDSLGWTEGPITLSAFSKPFDTWADMRHVLPAEDWQAPGVPRPARAVAYFCNVLADPPTPAARDDSSYPARRRAEVQGHAEHFLNTHVRHLWPGAATAQSGFRWELLCTADAATDSATGSERLASQFFAANINPSDRYVLALPGTLRFRISPLDASYDNLTICGDWTDCGFNEGCVEAAVMSGRLAAHALSLSPPLGDIIGYDHP